MLNVRLSLVFLILWLGILFNVERIYEPMNLASFVYVLTSCLAVLIICTPKLGKVTLLQITGFSLPVYGCLKWYFGYPFSGPNLPITVTECVVLCVTNLLAFRVSMGIDEFVTTAAKAAEMVSPRQPWSLKDSSAELYEEVQRARRFKRTLSLATLTFKGDASIEQLDSLFNKAKTEITRKYIESKVAQQLVGHCDAGDLVAFQNGEFVLLFPETSAEDVKIWMHRMEAELKSEIGIQLQVGVASFPDQECTLTGLVERAKSERVCLSEYDFSKPASRDNASENAATRSEIGV